MTLFANKDKNTIAPAYKSASKGDIEMKQRILLMMGAILATISFSHGQIYNLTIEGTDAIFLAGRTDVTIDPLDYDFRVFPLISSPLTRHNYGGPTFPLDFREETFPQFVPVAAGDVVKVLDPAIGGIHFYNNFGPPFYGPEGNMGYSNLWDVYNKFEGISMFTGPEGPLTGVFLTDDNPILSPGQPAALNYTIAANRNLTTYSPIIGEIFFIGDGQTDGSVMQEYIAPAGATRLFVGITDGFGFVGHPGAYEDNDGNYQIVIGVNEVPVLMIPVSIDIKPGSCPNPVNMNAKGVVSVAVCGTADFDVTQIDPTSVDIAEVLPLRWSYEDVATPYGPAGEDCYDCHELEGDGYMDIVFHFKTQELVAALPDVSDGDCVVLSLYGALFEVFGETPILGEDVILIIQKL